MHSRGTPPTLAVSPSLARLRKEKLDRATSRTDASRASSCATGVGRAHEAAKPRSAAERTLRRLRRTDQKEANSEGFGLEAPDQIDLCSLRRTNFRLCERCTKADARLPAFEWPCCCCCWNRERKAALFRFCRGHRRRQQPARGSRCRWPRPLYPQSRVSERARGGWQGKQGMLGTASATASPSAYAVRTAARTGLGVAQRRSSCFRRAPRQSRVHSLTQWRSLRAPENALAHAVCLPHRHDLATLPFASPRR